MDPIVNRIDRLERGLSDLRTSGSRAWKAEYKRQVLRQIQQVFADYGQREVTDKMGCMNDILYCSKRKYCKNAITSKIESASLAYLRGDGERTMEIIGGLQRQIVEGAEDCEAGECRIYALSIVSEVRTIFELAMRIESRVSTLDTAQADEAPLDPTVVSEMLTPLAHPARVSIMLQLEHGPQTFSDMSKSLGLRTGHLQFHLRALEDGGYVRREHKGGRYGLSLRGMAAITSLRSFASDLGPTGTKKGDPAMDGCTDAA